MNLKILQLNGGNHIIVHEGLQECKRPESNPFGCLITGDEASPHFEMIQAEAALQYAVSSIEKNDYTELFEAANYIKVRNVKLQEICICLYSMVSVHT